jgi:hypothetical protein
MYYIRTILKDYIGFLIHMVTWKIKLTITV